MGCATSYANESEYRNIKYEYKFRTHSEDGYKQADIKQQATTRSKSFNDVDETAGAPVVSLSGAQKTVANNVVTSTGKNDTFKGGKKDLDIYDEHVVKFDYEKQIITIPIIEKQIIRRHKFKPNDIKRVIRDEFTVTIRYLEGGKINIWGNKHIKCASKSFAKYLQEKIISFMSVDKQEEIKSNVTENEEIKDINSDTNDSETFMPHSHVQCIQGSDCPIIKKMMETLKIYETMDMKECEDKYDMFCNSTLLDDYIHIVSCHNDDLDKISEMNICEVTSCEISKRYNRRRYFMDEEQDTNLNSKHEEIEMLFWRNLLDGMHGFIYHLYDYGFRIKTDEIENNLKIESAPAFKQMFEIIQQKKQNVSEQIKTDPKKYNLHQYKSDITFTDALFEQLTTQKHANGMNEIRQSLMDDEYDTDAIEMDLQSGDIDSSNIARDVVRTNSDAIFVRDYIVHCNVTRNSFSIGYTFFYWNYYKPNEEQKVNENEKHFGNRNDLFGYKPHELYIEKKYNSLKEEILNNTICNLRYQYFQMSSYKADSIMQSKKAKSLTSAIFVEKRLHYGIDDEDEKQIGQVIRKEHILAIVLRCDWSKLCTAFTATFRKNQPFEALESVKSRNQEYANLSRLLREAVEYYGERAEGDYVEKKQGEGEFIKQVSGPFYCGMSRAMAIPQFNIRLCSPTSTTIHVEVATRFGGSDGMLIKLSTNGHCNAGLLRSFGCSWLSKFNEESERLFVGGQYTIRVQSITNLSTKENFAQFCRPLYYFDCMVKGITMNEENIKIKKRDRKLLDNMIKHYLKIDTVKHDCPSYIDDTFQSLIDTPTEIVFNLHELHTSFFKLKDLIIYCDEASKKNNIFREIILELFKNANEVTIYSTKPNGTVDYVINLLELFSFIKSSLLKKPKTFKITIKATRFEWKQDKPTWLKIAYNEFMENHQRIEETGKHLLDTNLTETFDHEGIKEDCLVIKIKTKK